MPVPVPVDVYDRPAARRVLTRLEDPDPLLDPASAARAWVAGAGIGVLPDGAESVL
ncbi:hypothetical protein ACIQAC_22740 [Streptomyces sp. NPDC088387]|uniref:hypothetical protein n=1 Tax=Streptomyces sp. NPDC088387 TaxID=3365859 RepID=UPI00382FAE35